MRHGTIFQSRRDGQAQQALGQIAADTARNPSAVEGAIYDADSPIYSLLNKFNELLTALKRP